MKTVMDAVSHFRAKFPGVKTIPIMNGTDIVSCCNLFELCVKDLSHHAGIKLFNEYVKADKKLLEKESKVDYTSEEFWEDAPEGATHYGSDCYSYNAAWYKDIEKNDFKCVAICYGGGWTIVNSSSDIISERKLIERPKPQPKESNMNSVFTQEMSDNGELPSVGMVVVDKRNNCEYEVLLAADSNGYYVMIGGDGSYYCKLLKYLKPIDTRTDKEKAIDEIYAEMNRRFELKKNDDNWLATDDTQVGMEFVIDYISKHGVKWAGK